MKKRKTLWRWWAKALGEKACKDDQESDKIAVIRTMIFVTYLVTNSFIIAGVIRHWNRPILIIETNEVPGNLHQKEENSQSSFL